MSVATKEPDEFIPGVNLLRPLQSNRLLSFPFVRHGVTFRVPGLGAADGNVGYGIPRDQADAWEMRRQWAEAIEFDATSIVGLRQVHGANVIEVRSTDAGKGAAPGSEPLGRADALFTREPGVTLMTLHADCLPILLIDPTTPAVAAIHAGWRGTVEDVAGATVRAMKETFRADSSQLTAFFAPSIGPCCYEVGDEVIQAWRFQAGEAFTEAIFERNGTTFLDLRRANQVLLIRAGIMPNNIEVAAVCTKCGGESWFSHRGQGPNTGRFAAFIALSGPST
ncbi:MAG: peptidoglycan editing factor PgeF [Thermomicrobiales bacterium]